ncbi:hypothetical protein WR25_17713 [Diploscapter pachys]|uniref:Uncharacterized protein n=1 Tax=Diploscapter pachys TaxID=2018661 RepID=A0A2A2LA10_9BILA|nr:hypothetical protein WR25_17713 [Diploscapter pachys]
MPDFYDSQNKEIKMVIATIFKGSTDLDAFYNWMKNEEIEFKELPTQEAMKENSTRHHDIEKPLSQIECKTSDDEPRPKRAKKDKLGTVNEMYDMYQLNPSLLTDKDESLISHPDFRLGNIRAAAVECRIFYNRNSCNGINDRIRKTVVFLMAQLFKHDNTRKYTIAQKLKPEMTKFPEQISAKIAAGMIKLIEMKPDAAKKGSETEMNISTDQWIQLIYQEIEHALRSSPTRNTTKPLFKQLSNKDHICKLKLDQQAVQSGWYENDAVSSTSTAASTSAPSSSGNPVGGSSFLQPFSDLPSTSQFDAPQPSTGLSSGTNSAAGSGLVVFDGRNSRQAVEGEQQQQAPTSFKHYWPNNPVMDIAFIRSSGSFRARAGIKRLRPNNPVMDTPIRSNANS